MWIHSGHIEMPNVTDSRAHRGSFVLLFFLDTGSGIWSDLSRPRKNYSVIDTKEKMTQKTAHERFILKKSLLFSPGFC